MVDDVVVDDVLEELLVVVVVVVEVVVEVPPVGLEELETVVDAHIFPLAVPAPGGGPLLYLSGLLPLFYNVRSTQVKCCCVG